MCGLAPLKAIYFFFLKFYSNFKTYVADCHASKSDSIMVDCKNKDLFVFGNKEQKDKYRVLVLSRLLL